MLSRKPHFIPNSHWSVSAWHGTQKPVKVTLSLILLLTTFSGIAAASEQAKSAPLRVKGSFLIAAICKDGIIVASDSRGTLKDRQGRPTAYYDINQKIFPMGNKLIAATGYSSLNDPNISFLSALMSLFAGNSLSRVEVDELPDSYFKYASLVLPLAGAKSAKVQTLVFAGFERSRPMVCLYDGASSGATVCRSSGYVSSPRQRVIGLEKPSSLSFQEAAHVMQRTIDDFAAAVQPGSVGGPVVIRTITRSTSRWLDKPPLWPNWRTFIDLADDYKSQRVLFHLMPGMSKAQLDTLIDDGASWTLFGQPSIAKPPRDTPRIDSRQPDR